MKIRRINLFSSLCTKWKYDKTHYNAIIFQLANYLFAHVQFFCNAIIFRVMFEKFPQSLSLFYFFIFLYLSFTINFFYSSHSPYRCIYWPPSHMSNPLKCVSCILYSIDFNPILYWITSFLIMSFLVYFHIHHNIFILVMFAHVA